MHPIEAKVNSYLQRSLTETVGMEEAVIDEAASFLKETLNKRFNGPPRGRFTLRMSNLGRPTCQLQMEAKGIPVDDPDASTAMKFIFGDVVEIVSLAILKASGVPVDSTSNKCEIDINGTIIKGMDDLEIDDAVWDIKSASPWAFNNKFSKGFDAVKAEDSFGYIIQISLYAKARDKKIGGFIVINKVEGKWVVVEAPKSVDLQAKEMQEAIEKVGKVIELIKSDAPFERCFSDKPETWYKKETGRRVLSSISCQYCDWKKSCWPSLTWAQAENSRAANGGAWKWYTDMGEKKDD